MRRWWIAICVGRHVYAWWPFAGRAMHDTGAKGGAGILVGASDPAEGGESRG